MSKPVDENLYNKVKTEVDKSYDKPSAYRSMAYTRAYLKAFREKYGSKKSAYAGKKPGELEGWRRENWIDIKSLIENPKEPIACGNAPIEKGEYPLCMPKNEAMKYSESELQLLLKRKSEIGKRRLVKDAFLRDVLEPEKIPAVRKYKQKYIRDRRIKLPKPLPEAKAEKILEEPSIKEELKEEKERRPRGRPRVEKEVVSEPKRVGRPTKPNEEKPIIEPIEPKRRGRKPQSEEVKQQIYEARLAKMKEARAIKRLARQEEKNIIKEQKIKETSENLGMRRQRAKTIMSLPPLPRNEEGEIMMSFD